MRDDTLIWCKDCDCITPTLNGACGMCGSAKFTHVTLKDHVGDRVAEHRPVSRPPAQPDAVKHDAGKAPWHLLPFDAVAQVVAVLAFGAKKYRERGWEDGISHSRTYAATLRHLTAWWQGEDRDPETGLSHLAHATCETLFALAFVTRNRADLDDRPK